jgi:hypothetical protein
VTVGELALLYAGAGWVAAVGAVARRRGVAEVLIMLALWPLYAPFLLLVDDGDEE